MCVAMILWQIVVFHNDNLSKWKLWKWSLSSCNKNQWIIDEIFLKNISGGKFSLNCFSDFQYDEILKTMKYFVKPGSLWNKNASKILKNDK